MVRVRVRVALVELIIVRCTPGRFDVFHSDLMPSLELLKFHLLTSAHALFSLGPSHILVGTS